MNEADGLKLIEDLKVTNAIYNAAHAEATHVDCGKANVVLDTALYNYAKNSAVEDQEPI